MGLSLMQSLSRGGMVEEDGWEYPGTGGEFRSSAKPKAELTPCAVPRKEPKPLERP